ncbi:MAG: alpha/beta fold hydrolase [Gemmatimonadaceae bacterium]|nr:alpha/beta fold hydrolase [Gemmatimonadaceae bacterium]
MTREYRPAWWLPDPHTATLWGRLGRREPRAHSPQLPVTTERWDTPDGDFVELVRLKGPTDPATPRLLLLHGLEGGLHSHYVRAMFREAQARGWAADLLLFRSCGSEPNRLPRSYHSGETSDPLWVITQLRQTFPSAPLGVVGVSLGGNVLCKLLGELGERAASLIRGAAAMSVPYDLARASRQIGRSFGTVYEQFFLKSLIPKALGKINRHAELAGLHPVSRVRTLWDFDDAFTAPVHGFASAADYYARASSLPYLDQIAVPTLLLNAVDDPFLPPEVLSEVQTVVANGSSDHVKTEFPARGGHVGFTAGRWPWSAWYYGEWRAAEFLAQTFSATKARP